MMVKSKPKTCLFKYNRVLSREISIIPSNEAFCLLDGFYFNEDKTLFIKTSEFAGKLFKPNGNNTKI